MIAETKEKDWQSQLRSQNSEQAKLDVLRNEIDNVDNALLAMLYQRFTLTRHVGEIKAKFAARAKSPDIYRPERELRVLNRLEEQSYGKLPPHLVYALWRQIFSFSSQEQGAQPLGYLCNDDENLETWMRIHFGISCQSKMYRDTQNMLSELSDGNIGIALLPNPKRIDWWSSLALGNTPNVFVVGSVPSQNTPPLILARRPFDDTPEQNARISSWLTFERDENTSLYSFQDYLKENNVVFELITSERAPRAILLEIQDFWQEDHKHLRTIRDNYTLRNMKILGHSFSEP